MVEDKDMGKDTQVIKNDGGSAFPGAGYSSYTSGGSGGGGGLTQPGMSLRDYFAAEAINGILSDPDAGMLDDDLLRYSRIAYRLADAMLEARK